MGSSPVAAAATPPIDSNATAATAAFTLRSLLGMVALRPTGVSGRDCTTAANSASSSGSPASSSGSAGPVAAASSLATP
jgi:hypothetical protein